MAVIKIRASALKPGDVILGEKDGHQYRLRVVRIDKEFEKPKKIWATLNDGGLSNYYVSIPWDRRHVVERSGGSSEASEPMAEAETPTRPRPALPEPSDRVAALIAEAREEFIAKVRKIIRENP